MNSPRSIVMAGGFLFCGRHSQEFSLTFWLSVGSTPYVRNTWRDGKIQRVEGLLNDFMVGLVRAAVVKATREQRLEEARRRRKREREERRKRKRRAELRKCHQDLHDQAKRWEKAERIRGYVAAVRERLESTGRALRALWLL